MQSGQRHATNQTKESPASEGVTTSESKEDETQNLGAQEDMDNEKLLQEKEKEDEVIQNYKKRLQEDDKTVIFEMFELLLTKMSTLQQDFTVLKKEQTQVSEQVKTLKTKLNFANKDIKSCRRELNEVNTSNIKLTEVAIRYEQDIDAAQALAEKCEKQFLRGCMLIRGIEEAENEIPKQLVLDFITEKLKIPEEIPIEIVSAHRIGNSVNRPLMV